MPNRQVVQEKTKGFRTDVRACEEVTIDEEGRGICACEQACGKKRVLGREDVEIVVNMMDCVVGRTEDNLFSPGQGEVGVV